MAIELPALRGFMGDTLFFSSVLTFGEVARLVEFAEEVDEWDDETEPEGKAQRKLNTQRVEREMVPYLLEFKDHFYSALTVEVRPPIDEGIPEAILFEQIGSPMPGGCAFGKVILDGTQTLYALDGQHRLQSIKRAIRQNPALAREHIAVILVPFRSLRRSQILFSDLNRYAKIASKSISLLFSHRDPVVSVTKRLANDVALLHGRVEMESTSLSKQTPHMITLSTLYEMTRAFRGGRSVDEDTLEVEAAHQKRIWAELVANIEPWKRVEDRVEHPAYLRAKYLCMHGVGQQAIGIAAATVLQHCNGDLKVLAGLSKCDWMSSNPEWQGIVVQGRRVNNTSTSVRNLSTLLTFKLGVMPDPSEALSLCEIILARGERPPAALAECAAMSHRI